MLGVVEDQHVAGGRLGGDDAGVLWHVASTVHLSLMVYLDLDLNLPTHRSKASKLCPDETHGEISGDNNTLRVSLFFWDVTRQTGLTSFLAVVVRGVKLGIIIRQLHTGDDQVVLLVRGVCAKHKPVDTVVLPLRPAECQRQASD